MTEFFYLDRAPKRLTKFLLTSEDWLPSYGEDLKSSASEGIMFVKIDAFEMYVYEEGEEGLSRVCCWGMDDLGMEIDVIGWEQAEEIYKSLEAPVSFESLEALGFQRA